MHSAWILWICMLTLFRTMIKELVETERPIEYVLQVELLPCLWKNMRSKLTRQLLQSVLQRSNIW